MTKVIDSVGLGTAIPQATHDANWSSVCGINESQTGTTYTVDINDQNRTIEHSNASAVTVTLTLQSTITAALHTDDFKCTHKNIGAGVVTLTCSGADTFEDGSTTQTLAQYEHITIQTDSTGAIWNILDNSQSDFVTGTVTTASLAQNAEEQNDVTHGLGTDDIDFGFSLIGGDATLASAMAVSGIGMRPDGSYYAHELSGSRPSNPTLPSSGKLALKVKNTSINAQTIAIKWWVRRR